ncbi:MAG: hypothetical protein ACK55I_49825, partial [bacterium]
MVSHVQRVTRHHRTVTRRLEIRGREQNACRATLGVIASQECASNRYRAVDAEYSHRGRVADHRRVSGRCSTESASRARR